MAPERDFIPTPGLQNCIDELDNLLSHSPEYPILICGETGSGKSFFYKRIIEHFQKDKRTAPSKIINCAAFPKELIESELFGHEKGAFTGAAKAKKGLLTSANGGVSVLDEIGELPKYCQAKLLTFLDTGLIRPIGSVNEVKVNTFIVGTTTASPKKFRDDFWHRFHKLYIPPLHKRRIDILYLMREFCGDTPVFGWQILECLCKPWHGNVRELHRKYHNFTIKSQMAQGDIESLFTNAPYEVFVRTDLDEIRRLLVHPSKLLRSPYFSSEANLLKKHFPTLLSDDSLVLKKCDVNRLNEIYQEFFSLCWHFEQDPQLDDDIMTYILKGQASTTTQNFMIQVKDNFSYHAELRSTIRTIYTKIQSDSQPLPDPIPLDLCSMEEVIPDNYKQKWLEYHLLIRKRTAKELAARYGINYKKINRWQNQYLKNHNR